MRFVKIADIKEGQRLAKPIYNSDGVLLYGRGTVVNKNTLYHINNMTSYGLYILDATEPLPDMTEEEIEFERFQTMACASLKDELPLILQGNSSLLLDALIKNIVDSYGSIPGKITFIQSIRNPDDSVFKHSLNVAMLCALISNKLGVDRKEQMYLVASALYHDIGKLIAPAEIINKPDKLSQEELTIVRDAELKGYDIVRNNYQLLSGVKRYITQLKIELANKLTAYGKQQQTLLLGTKILQVADMYDTLTAMRVYKEPTSEYSAIMFLQDHSEQYDEDIVNALISSINILPPGCCVELSNGEKGLVLSESQYYPLRPSILSFGSNVIYDLSNKKTYDSVKIKDILKTMDNRFQMSKPENLK